MGLHSSYIKTRLIPIESSIKVEMASILLHLHSLGIISHLQFSTSVPKLPYLNELENLIKHIPHNETHFF
jgi:hypothetical protein